MEALSGIRALIDTIGYPALALIGAGILVGLLFPRSALEAEMDRRKRAEAQVDTWPALFERQQDFIEGNRERLDSIQAFSQRHNQDIAEIKALLTQLLAANRRGR